MVSSFFTWDAFASPDVCDVYISETHGTKKALHRTAKRLRVKSAPKREHGTRSIPRDLEKTTFPVPGRRQVSWLAALHPSPSRFPSGRASQRPTDFSAYSDEIAQALHLFPFYPLPPLAAKAPTAFVIQLLILYPRPVPAVKTKRLSHDAAQWLCHVGLEPTTLNGGKAWSKTDPCTVFSLLCPDSASLLLPPAALGSANGCIAWSKTDPCIVFSLLCLDSASLLLPPAALGSVPVNGLRLLTLGRR